MGRKTTKDFDRELASLAPDARWQVWMRRIEAVLFASAKPVSRKELARVVGQTASVHQLIADLKTDLEGRAFEIATVGEGWILRTRPAYAETIRLAGEVTDAALSLAEFDVAVLAAIAYHQPITREGLKDIFGKTVSRDLIGRLHACELIGNGPRSPRKGAPVTYVTTERFLVAFDLKSLQDLPDRAELLEAGLLQT